MKQITLILLLCCTMRGFSQAPVEITPQKLKQIETRVNQDIELTKARLKAEDWSPEQREYIVDTMRIERLFAATIEIDYSTAGMVNAGYEARQQYDVLLNKYYKKLMAILKGDDKNTLVQAQKAWLAFRDAEFKLIGIVSKEEYSGGGTMQSLIDSAQFLAIVKQRTQELFDHLTRTIRQEQ
ncbi:lysozyme inhibitor LprI family protein [Flavihumibacter petaseus]|uniref:Lysozyme inhibitor LprI-like N-terminal domain-containing protein n=1 Tax=Flavihumibacter petaseus NBRC 106054 TaxID=1220578 RepID=A0A0E9N135_9BACT|nr:lysozyme inhibitor LprI family protein [Flavihumibacter petaseus]GAO43569.1 hypothetical protein FPE01S_02_06740 [Flavihumibacter petaseus NBRC 106054]